MPLSSKTTSLPFPVAPSPPRCILHHARTTTEHLTNLQLVYRTEADGEALLVALNLAGEPAAVPAAGEVLAGRIDGGTLPAHGWAVLAPR